MPFRHAQQPLSRDRLIGTLDLNQLKLADNRYTINQSRGRCAQHHPTRRGHRLHPLSHPHLLADSGVTERPRTDLTGDHLARVQADPQLQLDSVAVLDLNRELCSFASLDGQGRKTRANSVILQGCWRAEDSHDPVAGEAADRAAKVLNHHCRTVDQIGHDLAQPLRTNGRRNVHRVHHVGEQHRHLLVLSRLGGRGDGRAAFVAELGVRWQFGAARPTRQSRSCQRTATPLSSTSVSCHRWSAMSVISPCHLRHEVLRPSFVVCFKTRGGAMCRYGSWGRCKLFDDPIQPLRLSQIGDLVHHRESVEDIPHIGREVVDVVNKVYRPPLPGRPPGRRRSSGRCCRRAA